jgi:hypothetical protein
MALWCLVEWNVIFLFRKKKKKRGDPTERGVVGVIC